jgi:hypothetical protein
MAWSHLQSTGAASDTFSSVTYTSNVSSGTKLIAATTVFSGTVTAVKDGSGNSFTKLASIGLNNSTANGELALWAIDTPAGDVGTKPVISPTTTASGPAIAMVIQEVSGLLAGNTSAMLDGTAATSFGTITTSGNAVCGTYSTHAASEYLVALYGDDENSNTVAATPTGSTSYTLDAGSQQNNAIENCSVAYGNSTNGAETCTFGLTNSGTATDWGTVFVAFKLASAAAPAVAPVFTGRRAPALPQRQRQHAFQSVPAGTVTLGQYLGGFTRLRLTWPPPRRGRAFIAVPPGGINAPLPFGFTGRRANLLPPVRKGRVFLPVPPGATNIPPLPFTGFTGRRANLLPPVRKGRVFLPVPPGVTQVIAPSQFVHGRTGLSRDVSAPRRGRGFTVVQPLIVQQPGGPLALGPPSRRFLALAMPRRGRAFVPVYPATPAGPASFPYLVLPGQLGFYPQANYPVPPGVAVGSWPTAAAGELRWFPGVK